MVVCTLIASVHAASIRHVRNISLRPFPVVGAAPVVGAVIPVIRRARAVSTTIVPAVSLSVSIPVSVSILIPVPVSVSILVISISVPAVVAVAVAEPVGARRAEVGYRRAR